MITATRLMSRLLIFVGNSLTSIGCVGLILGSSGLIPAEFFAIGISSGIRVIGSVAIAGCLLSAVGYGVVDYLEK
jgi:hydroxyethylthiazole kinase-like sugar kinase family protein